MTQFYFYHALYTSARRMQKYRVGSIFFVSTNYRNPLSSLLFFLLLRACVETGSSCPQGSSYHSLNGKCYYISIGATLSWFKAREFCVNLGGDLVKIHTEDEWTSLKSNLTSSKYWIGLVGLVWYWPNGLLLAVFCCILFYNPGDVCTICIHLVHLKLLGRPTIKYLIS